MKKTYSVQIDATKQHVWSIMLGKETYPQWVKGFSENSEMVGEWKQGATVDFIDGNIGGTRAILEVVDEPNRLFAKHVTVLDKHRKPMDGAETWIGTTEEYLLTEKEGVTTLSIVMNAHSDYEKMLDDGWKKSLQFLKALCEQ